MAFGIQKPIPERGVLGTNPGVLRPQALNFRTQSSYLLTALLFVATQQLYFWPHLGVFFPQGGARLSRLGDLPLQRLDLTLKSAARKETSLRRGSSVAELKSRRDFATQVSTVALAVKKYFSRKKLKKYIAHGQQHPKYIIKIVACFGASFSALTIVSQPVGQIRINRCFAIVCVCSCVACASKR